MRSNILLIIIDGFRADKCYGNKKTSKTPNIDSLIKNGVYFSHAISSSNATMTCMGSIFTALYPFQSGITPYAAHSKATKYFDILKNNEYYLYATVPDVSFWETLTVNFDDKDLYPKPYVYLYGGTGQQIIDRFESKKMKEPWVYYIHIMDLHRSVKFPFPPEYDKEEFGYEGYERTVSAIDFWIGKILQQINLDNTLVVITSDHGEFIPIPSIGNEINYIPTLVEKSRVIKKHTPKFLEPFAFKIFLLIRDILTPIRAKILKRKLTDDEMRTLNLRVDKSMWDIFDEIYRTPLIFSGYNISSHKIITQQVRQIDIFPTIAELIGIKDDYPEKEGQSLVPLIQGRQLMESPAYIETVPSLKKSEGAVIGIRTSHYKYYRARNNPKKNVVLFDLQNDPSEKTNIAMDRSDIVEQMEKVLEQIRNSSLIKSEPEQITKDEVKKIEQELRKLGYM